MNTRGKRSRPLLMFYILVTYVVIQFSWWTYSMFELNNEISHLKNELNLLKGESPDEVIANGNMINLKLEKRWLMISGEGAVFIGLLLLGIYQIRRTLKKENELSDRQRNFLLSVTHEFKSPLASTKLQLQTLEKHELNRDKQKELLTDAINDVDRLTKLVDDILVAAKIENNGFPLNYELVNLSDYLQNGIDQLLRGTSIKQKLIVHIEPGISMQLDKVSFPSIVLNLIENAGKYSPETAPIEIELRRQEGSIVLSVRDQGKGIPEQEKSKILEKFYRIGNEETRRTKGTGLGLYIVNYLVEQHRGKLSIKNNLPQGSCFEVSFKAE